MGDRGRNRHSGTQTDRNPIVGIMGHQKLTCKVLIVCVATLLRKLVSIVAKNTARHVHGLTKLYAISAEVLNLSEGEHAVIVESVIVDFRPASLIVAKAIQFSVSGEIFIMSHPKLQVAKATANHTRK